VLNFLAGRAAINVLARRAGARVVVVDVGVAAELPANPGLVARKVRPGTRHIAEGPAMVRDEDGAVAGSMYMGLQETNYGGCGWQAMEELQSKRQ